MSSQIKPHKIIAVTETTRVRHFKLARRAVERVAVWRGFRLVASLSAVLMALLLGGCGRDNYHARVGVRASSDVIVATKAAIEAWNAKDARVHLEYADDASEADVIVSVGATSHGRCAETTDAGIVIDSTPAERCSAYDPATAIAHELGHFMSGRGHTAEAGALMNRDGNTLPVEEAITDDDVRFVIDLQGKAID